MTFSKLTISVLLLPVFFIGFVNAAGLKPEFNTNFCAANEESKNVHILKSSPSQSLVTFCQAISSDSVAISYVDYMMYIQIFGFQGTSTGNRGHPGIIFNARDFLNYDFVFFRPGSTTACYQTGYVSNGNVYYRSSSYCPDGTFTNKSWRYFKIYVRYRIAYLMTTTGSGRLVAIIKTGHNPVARGGALVTNGHENLVFFKSYNIYSAGRVPVASSLMKGCSTGTGWASSYIMVLNSVGGTWPSSGFCRVMYHSTSSLSGAISSYRLRVWLYNIRSKSGTSFGHPGVMYNVRDLDNFDFVYFRPHSTSGCYQTGYVKNGAVTTRYSGSCPSRATRTSCYVEVKVYSHYKVQIYLNRKLVRTVSSYFTVKRKAGVIVANGYDNTVQAESFYIYNI